MAKNFREFFQNKLPESFWSDEKHWLSRLTNLTLFPYDIYLQLTDYVSRIRDVKKGSTPDDGLNLIGQERLLEKYSRENSLQYGNKLAKSWEIWKASGSRFGLNLLFKLSNIELDNTTFEYGIEERLDNIYPNYWGAKNMFWSKYYYGGDGYVDSAFTYCLYIKDPTTNLSVDPATKRTILKYTSRFAPANTRLCFVYFTNGNGLVHTTIDVRYDFDGLSS